MIFVSVLLRPLVRVRAAGAVAARFGVSVSSVVKWSQRYRATGSVAPGKMGGHRRRVLEPHRAFIVERINQSPNLTLHRLKDELAARGVKVSHNAVWHVPPARGPELQKKRCSPLSRLGPTSLAGANAGDPGRAGLDPQRLVFIDETWIKTNMAPLRGWGPRGQRLRGFAPHGHWRTLTFLGALRCDDSRRLASSTGRSTANASAPMSDQQLVPVLRPGDIVVMDNLGSHKSAAIRHIIKAAGARLWFLPPYSPTSIRSSRPSPRSSTGCAHAQKRTIEDTWRHIGHLVEPSNQPNAPTTSQTPATLPSKHETL